MSIARYDGKDTSDYETPENLFAINITTTASRSRSYISVLGLLTREQDEGPCLFVRGNQSDAIERPNDDSIIEGHYLDYIVSGAFFDDFNYGMFDSVKYKS